MLTNQLLCISVVVLGGCFVAPAQHPKNETSAKITAEELKRTITALDAALFDAYNRCDLKTFSDFLADDLELYHDQDGLVIGSRALTENVKKYVCGGDVRRKLVAGTLEVHPIEGYGAICTGVHRFLHPKSNAPARERSFVNVWRYRDGVWKVTRSLSFDRQGIR